MPDKKELSDEELKNLHDKLEIFSSDLSRNPEKIVRFRTNPITFLSEYKITALKYVTQSVELARKFISSVRRLIRGITSRIGSCLKCKIAALLIMLGTLGKIGLAWEALLDVVGSIISTLKKYFDKTGDWIEKQFGRLDKAVDGYTPSDLAIKICRDLGYCIPTK